MTEVFEFSGNSDLEFWLVLLLSSFSELKECGLWSRWRCRWHHLVWRQCENLIGTQSVFGKAPENTNEQTPPHFRLLNNRVLSFLSFISSFLFSPLFLLMLLFPPSYFFPSSIFIYHILLPLIFIMFLVASFFSNIHLI